jgi:parallel beta-helix repeat protein
MVRRIARVSLVLSVQVLAAGVATALDPPAVFWASAPVRPNETVLIAGNSLIAADATPAPTTVELAALDGPPGSPPVDREPTVPPDAVWQPQPLLRGDAESVACVVPGAWPQGVWACRVRRGDAVSEPVVLNAPVAWWFLGDAGDATAPGSEVRVFGHSLQFEGAGIPAAWLRTTGGMSVPLKVSAASCYALTVQVPADVEPGSHALWIHNGLGGPAGWRLAGRLDVATPRAWKTDRFNVRDFGPKHEAAILAAIAKAKENGGGVVYLPRGRYGLTKPLDIPDGVVLAGESRELVSLFWSDFENPPPSLVSGGRYGLENLSLYCQNHRTVVVAKPGSEGFFMRQVRIRANCYFMIERPGKEFRGRTGPPSNRDIGAGVSVQGTNFEIHDCDILASDWALFLKNARQGRISGNTFLYGGRGYRIESSRDIIFENNTVEGFDLSAIGNDISTFWSNACTNIYFANNTLRRMFGADREMMTLDAGGGAYTGTLAAVEVSKITLAADPDFHDYAPKPHQNWTGASVMILQGKGAGQYRIVTGHRDREWEIDRPWVVPPDTKSMISIVPFRGRNLFIGNACEDGGPFQLYGSAHECIVAGNTGRRMDGFLVWGLDPHGWGMQPSWYCQFLDNQILEGNAYGHRTGGFGVAAAGKPDDGKGRSLRDVVFRRNHCLSNAGISIGGNLHGAVVEHNVIEQADRGITVKLPATGVIVRENTMRDVGTPLGGDGLSAAVVGAAGSP